MTPKAPPKRTSTPGPRMMWVHDRLVPEEEARIPLMSPTSQYGLNVFEVVRCYLSHDKDQLLSFRFAEHVERLQNSARTLKLEFDARPQDLLEICARTVHANDLHEDLTVRLTLFVNGPGSWSYRGPCSLMVAVSRRGRVEGFDAGLSACVSSWERIHERSMSPRVKTGANYINSRMAQLEAKDNGYDMALFLNREGMVSESVGSCIFVLKRGKLLTPSLNASILDSITRASVLQLAEEDLGLPVAERPIDRTELYTCDEIFLAGTTAEIVPVTSVDRIPVGDGKVGDLTRSLRDTYFEVARGKNPRRRGWIQDLSGTRP